VEGFISAVNSKISFSCENLTAQRAAIEPQTAGNQPFTVQLLSSDNWYEVCSFLSLPEQMRLSLIRNREIRGRVAPVLDFNVRQECRKVQRIFEGILNFPSMDRDQEYQPLYCRHYLAEAVGKVMAVAEFKEILRAHSGDFAETAQEIRDADLLRAFSKILPKTDWDEVILRQGISNQAECVRGLLKMKKNQEKFLGAVEIHLENANLTSLPLELIRYFPNLRVLDLSNNQINVLPQAIGTLIHLEEICFGENEVQELPDSLGALVHLTSMDFSSNRIRHIPPAIGGLVQLEELNVADNQIQELPDSLGALVQLNLLDFSSNRIRNIPPAIGALVQLEELYVADNQIQELPDLLGALVHLRNLDCSNNRIRKIPDFFRFFTFLNQLDLSSNQIREIPDVLGVLANLRGLHLEDNEIHEIPDSIRTLPLLRLLNLSRNQLSSIPKALCALVNLRRLGLSNNFIQEVPLSVNNLLHLRHLYLEDNGIRAILAPIVDNFRNNRRKMHLRGNPLSPFVLVQSEEALPTFQALILENQLQ
jgi:Leucine-rich repeat (LRR) protein